MIDRGTTKAVTRERTGDKNCYTCAHRQARAHTHRSCVSVCPCGWVMGGWVDGWLGGWVGGRMDGWVGGWLGGWMMHSQGDLARRGR